MDNVFGFRIKQKNLKNLQYKDNSWNVHFGYFYWFDYHAGKIDSNNLRLIAFYEKRVKKQHKLQCEIKAYVLTFY